jgi:hypothetical protein
MICNAEEGRDLFAGLCVEGHDIPQGGQGVFPPAEVLMLCGRSFAG